VISGILEPAGFTENLKYVSGTLSASELFGLWRVYFPPVLINRQATARVFEYRDNKAGHAPTVL
jgi:hypothetical protein